MREKIEVEAYAGEIIRRLPAGALVTVKAAGCVNPMTIGWGTLGIQWGRKLFIAYIRECRYSKALFDEAEDFTVNVPLDDSARGILAFCGSHSGRDTDKIARLGLTPVDGELVASPALRELPLTLECRIIYRQKQDDRLLPHALYSKYYRDNDPNEPLESRNSHTAYYGEIVNAYILK